MKLVDMTDRPELDEVTCFGYRRLKITCDDELADEIVSLAIRKPKTAHWYDVGSLSCRCSNCGCKNNRDSRFCPNCGAKM